MWEFILQQLNNNPNSIIFDSDKNILHITNLKILIAYSAVKI